MVKDLSLSLHGNTARSLLATVRFQELRAWIWGAKSPKSGSHTTRKLSPGDSLCLAGWIQEATNTSRIVLAAFVNLSGDSQAEYEPIKFSETTVVTAVQHPPECQSQADSP